MSRVIAFVACGFTLAACSASMPSLDFLKSSPPTETVRIESQPPGADARTSQGQTCRTPCELTIQGGGGDTSVTVALNGYQPQTVALQSDQGDSKLSPNPVFVELQAAAAPKPAKKRVAKRKKPNTAVAAKPAATQPAPATTASIPTPPPAASAEPPAVGGQYPWPSR